MVNLHATIVTPFRPPAALRADGLPVSVEGTETQRLTRAMARLDEAAFREFHAAYFDRLLRYLFVITRDDQVARDALQETFVRIARHARPFDTEDAFWSWLTVLARSAAIDIARKRHRYWRLINSCAVSWLARVTDPDQENDERLLALIEEGMAGLLAQDRQLVIGKYLRGATVRSLATEHGLSEKAVESRLRRARLQLRAELARRLNDET